MPLQVYLAGLIVLGVIAVTFGDMVMAQRHTLPFLEAISLPLLLNIVGVILLLGCYYYGYKYTKSIWYVSIVYVCTIAISQPIVAYLVLRDVPTLKQMCGFILGIAGILIAM
jgi:drug/metabolite transporter (DMT)-like permease